MTVAQLPVSALSFPDTRGRPRDTQDGKSKGLEPAVRAVCQKRVPKEGASKLDRETAFTRSGNWREDTIGRGTRGRGMTVT